MDQRLLRGARRLSPGSLEGRSEQAQPRPQPPRGSIYRPPEDETEIWSQSGAVAITPANGDPVHDIRNQFDTLLLIARVRVVGSTATIWTVYLEGVSIGTITIAASSLRQTGTINNVGGDVGEGLSARITTAGAGAYSASLKTIMRS